MQAEGTKTIRFHFEFLPFNKGEVLLNNEQIRFKRINSKSRKNETILRMDLRKEGLTVSIAKKNGRDVDYTGPPNGTLNSGWYRLGGEIRGIKSGGLKARIQLTSCTARRNCGEEGHYSDWVHISDSTEPITDIQLTTGWRDSGPGVFFGDIVIQEQHAVPGGNEGWIEPEFPVGIDGWIESEFTENFDAPFEFRGRFHPMGAPPKRRAFDTGQRWVQRLRYIIRHQ